jgi:hypothetical protein
MPGLFSRRFENAAPAGWVELQEFGGVLECDDGTIPHDSAPRHLLDMCEEALRLGGMELRISNHLEGLLHEAGFVSVCCKTIRVPVGAWSQNKGFRVAGYFMGIALLQFSINNFSVGPGVFHSTRDLTNSGNISLSHVLLLGE